MFLCYKASLLCVSPARSLMCRHPALPLPPAGIAAHAAWLSRQYAVMGTLLVQVRQNRAAFATSDIPTIFPRRQEVKVDILASMSAPRW